ncbi:uncharacterized protein B0H18DRAFT_527551 [Fomitopsis serialis]|uniref:uncharacterized protein n=1 Tax=Fomitopsis serialis TaxID=139415 RepID=UPI0020085309|nr:uncharacterized protein B0H18DRAFT_527551 [Neoantrodia serialis]KAH9922114.1 hypothetical protein B0H18DRAFT_527551 [Neoantrodia serialis]
MADSAGIEHVLTDLATTTSNLCTAPSGVVEDYRTIASEVDHFHFVLGVIERIVLPVAQRSHTTLASLISNKVGAYKEAVKTFMKTFEQYDKVFGRASHPGEGGMVARTYWKFHWWLRGKDKTSFLRTLLRAAYLDLGAAVALLTLHVTSGVPNLSRLTVYKPQTGNGVVRERKSAASIELQGLTNVPLGGGYVSGGSGYTRNDQACPNTALAARVARGMGKEPNISRTPRSG